MFPKSAKISKNWKKSAKEKFNHFSCFHCFEEVRKLGGDVPMQVPPIYRPLAKVDWSGLQFTKSKFFAWTWCSFSGVQSGWDQGIEQRLREL
jgi:hypothetical protein